MSKSQSGSSDDSKDKSKMISLVSMIAVLISTTFGTATYLQQQRLEQARRDRAVICREMNSLRQTLREIVLISTEPETDASAQQNRQSQQFRRFALTRLADVACE